jgi:cysteinyl-tRNA synthetase
MLDILGLRGVLEAEELDVPAEARALLAAREQARGARDWIEADRLRDELRALGFEVRDGPAGPELRPI